MALSYPLDRDDFLGALRIRSFSLELGERMEVSGLADGSVLRDQLGPRLWRGRVELHPAPFAQARAMAARLALLQEPGRSFLAWPVEQTGPARDPKGLLLGAAAPQIASLAPDARDLSLSGLPAGYELSCGDGLSFLYGSDPVRYAFHRIVTGSVVADGTGATSVFEVVPSLRAGAAIGTPVTLLRPAFKAVLLPGTVTAGSSERMRTGGASFEFIQTLR